MLPQVIRQVSVFASALPINKLGCSTKHFWFFGATLALTIMAVKLTSSRTQLPYEYYSLPFCRPTEITYKAENLGDVRAFRKHKLSSCGYPQGLGVFYLHNHLSFILYYHREDVEENQEPTYRVVRFEVIPQSIKLEVVAMLGMLSPSSRGALMTTACFLFMFMGVFGGFFAGRLYRTLKGHRWKKGAFCVSLVVFCAVQSGLLMARCVDKLPKYLWTATLYPGVVFGICFVLNCFIWGKHSSGAVPFPTMVALLCMWFGISLPLVYLGYYFGFRKQPYDNPVRTNQIPRQIPEQRWYMNKFVGILMAGILPFGAMFIELFFIFSAIWENQFYYLFGFLFLVFIILVVSCSQISIVMVYFQLCAEDYRWWWRTFLVSGGSAFYVLIYAIFYFVNKLDIVEFIPSLLYFGYTALMVLSFWLLTGTIGFYAAYMFVRKIYAAVKID
ncbi:transmembrane 9 superfamily member 4 [Limosa lapponica baueri]|uniref:Transmembrane 9 superfamily member n=1 Tax=Limosa lapponica baueri TaxID=1758121 RepID=A0A2I0TBZ0_LIMLA|nr:transmembrane 9 superfamily member 4 [Limosa lapponica baueri]